MYTILLQGVTGSSGNPILNLIFNYAYIWVPVLICAIIVRVARGRGKNEQVTERMVHTQVTTQEKVLVICPFCSSKVEQGTSFCPNCGGKL